MKKHAIYFFLMFALTGGIWSGCQSGAKKIQVKGEITSVDRAQMLYNLTSTPHLDAVS